MRLGLSLVSLAVLSFMIARCSHAPALQEAKMEPTGAILTDKALSQTMAETRARLVHDVKYTLEVTLDKTQYVYSGVQKIAFNLSQVEGDLPLDFREGDVQLLTINGIAVEKVERGPAFLRLPQTNLKAGENNVEIKFKHPYSHAGAGLHRFNDTEDKNVYLYTQFEPWDANRFAPFFDQPDLKATMTMTVHAPQDWVVITNTNETSRTNKNKVSTWVFGTTPKLSTYLFALIAGPYAEFDSHYKEKKMRLFVRKEMANFVEHKEWLKISEQGLGFYENYFGIPYPFEKFDQIIVPEFNAGAMENAGAITYNERYLKRSGYTRQNRVSIYGVVLHEMAHQWFGDLVTMKWWNDLWLNESFATAMSLVSEVGATEYKEAPRGFVDAKAGAQREDEMITTHPISGVVKDAISSNNNFDGITYNKGASVLRELYFYVGDETFRKALNYYFTKHAYQNTTLEDFIAAFNETTHSDMTAWFKTWLSTTGVDEIATAYTCAPDGVTIRVRNQSKTPRIHSLKIGRYRLENGKVVFDGATDYRTTIDDGTFLVPAREGGKIACPDMIYANVDNQAYVKLLLDEKTTAFLQKHVSDIPDAMLRQQVWADLWQMVRDQKFRLADFTAMALRALQIEDDPDILRSIASRAVGGASEFDSAYYYWPRTTDEEKRELVDLKRNFAQVLWSRMTHSEKNSDLEKLFTDYYLRAAGEDSQLERLQKMTKTLKDQDRRWNLLNTLCRLGSKDCTKLVNNELKHDKSDVAQKSAYGCRAAQPNADVKREFLTQLSADKPPYQMDILRTISYNLFPALERDLMPDFSNQIYKDFSEVWSAKRDETHHAYIARSLAPLNCSRKANSQLDSTLRSDGASWPSTLRKPLQQAWDEDSRCIKIRHYNGNPATTFKYET